MIIPKGSDDIGLNLKEARLKKNMDIFEVAKIIQISPIMVKDFEEGDWSGGRKNFEKICEVIHADPYELIHGVKK